MFPVRLELRTSLSEGEALKSVKEQLRGVANRGMSYGLLRYCSDDSETRAALSQTPRSDLLFNYLGQFDQVVSDSKLFSFAAESTGPWHGPAVSSHACSGSTVPGAGRQTGDRVDLSSEYSSQ